MSSLKETVDNIFPDFAWEGLNAHNEFRQKHGCPDLHLSRELTTSAQEYADTCAKKGSVISREDLEYGENTFTSDKSHPGTTREAVYTWYDERKKWSYGCEQVKKKSRNFTQMIWKSTTDVGFGLSQSSKGKVFIIANYNPKGNTAGEFSNNVPEPLVD